MKLAKLIFLSFVLLTSCNFNTARISEKTMEGTLIKGEVVSIHTPDDKIRRNEIVMYEYVEDLKWIARVIAVSGDTIEIKHGEVFVNGEKVPNPPLAKLGYSIQGDSFVIDSLKKIYEQSREGLFLLTAAEKKEIEEHFKNIEIVRMTFKPEYEDKYVLKLNGKAQNLDNFGPMYVPMSDEGEDQYFLMGDNRYNVFDSRSDGLIKRSQIKGIVVNNYSPKER